MARGDAAILGRCLAAVEVLVYLLNHHLLISTVELVAILQLLWMNLIVRGYWCSMVVGWRRHHHLQFVGHLVAEVLLDLEIAYLVHLAVKERLVVVMWVPVMALILHLFQKLGHFIVSLLLLPLLLIIKFLQTILLHLSCVLVRDHNGRGRYRRHRLGHRWNGQGLRSGRLVFGLAFLLSLKLLHLGNGNRGLAVDPLALDIVLVSHFGHLLHGPQRRVCDEAEASGLLRALVLQDNTVL